MTAVKYIDLKNVDFTVNGDPVTIKGIFNEVYSTRKRIVLTNFKFGGFERHDISGTVRYDSSKIHITSTVNSGIFDFEISNDDSIKFTATKWVDLIKA